MTTQSNGNNLIVQGRLVWLTGNTIFEGKQKTDFNTNAPVFGQDGNPVMNYGFGLSIPKLDPTTGQPSAEFQKIWTALHSEAYTLYPDGNIPPGFAMKYKDGDGIDHNGKKFSLREGYEGCLVISCTTQIAIKCFKFSGGNNELINTGIKCGDYVNVQLNIKAHPTKGNAKAGLYVNPTAVQLIQEGKEIINTPSGDDLFGTSAPAYNGVVEAPVVTQMPHVAAPAYNNAPPAMPHVAPPVAPPAMPHVAPPVTPPVAAPHYAILPQGHQQPAPVAAPAMPGVPPMPGMPR